MDRTIRLRLAATFLILGWTLTASAGQDQRPSSNPPSAPYGGATVSDWTGKVLVQPPGSSLAFPTRQQALPPGTLLDTGDGRLLLRLEDESEILVRPHTRLLLTQPGPGGWNYFELLLGRIRTHIMKRTGGAPPFQLGTPSAVIAVRGTRFDVEVNSHKTTEVDVFEGLVEVAGVGIPGASVLVRAGYSTRVGPGGAPETPVPTQEIRPGFEASDERMAAEFAREGVVEVNRGQENEMTERADSQAEELEEEAREGREGPQDPDHDEPKPKQ